MPKPSGHTLLFAHPSPDLYGSDLQLLETLDAFTNDHRVIVVMPARGPLVSMMRKLGLRPIVRRFPVLRKSVLTPAGAPTYLVESILAVAALTRMMRNEHPVVIYVNTITIPAWNVAAALARAPLVVHVHEAEDRGPRILRTILLSPLLFANQIIVNSNASRDQLLNDLPWVSRRTTVINNGVPDNAEIAAGHTPISDEQDRVVYVGRLSPRKGTDLALEAVAILRSSGADVRLVVCGECYPGYEWFREELFARASKPDLNGAVEFLGYVHEPSTILAGAKIALVPSRAEPFGNVAVEALLSGVPVVAANVQGLAEIIKHRFNGRLFTPGDAAALAHEMQSLLSNPDEAEEMARVGRQDALERFGLDKYKDSVRAIVAAATGVTHGS